MFCPKCGAQLPDVAKFCNKCGADLRMLSDTPHKQPQEYPKPAFNSSAAISRSPKMKKSVIIAAVVIAIVAIIAAILIPSTMNYQKKSKLKAANSMAKVAAVSLSDLLTDAMYNGMSAYDIMYGYTSGDGTYSGGGAIIDVKESYAVKTDFTYNVSDPESIQEGGAKKIAQALSKLDSAGYFIIMQSGTAGYGGERMVIQWKAEPDSKIIGQCVMDIGKDWEFYHGYEVYDEINWDSYKKERPSWGHYY